MCTTTLNTQLTGHVINGIFQYIGYSNTSTGTPVLSNYPPPFSAMSLNQGYTTSVNWNNMAVGFYTFNYIVGTAPCTNTSTIKVEVRQQPTIPTSPATPFNLCNTSTGTYNLMSLIPGATPGTWALTYNGTPVTFPVAYVTGSQPNLVFNPNGRPAGQYVFTYTSQTPSSTYTPATCSDCNPVSVAVTFNISSPIGAPGANNQNVCL